MTLPSFLANWPFQVPNLVLSILMYTLIGRMLLGLVLPAGSNNYIMRFFERLTDPVVRAVRLAAPGIVPLPVLVAFGVVWLFALRIGLVVAFAAAGALPTPPT
jgi:YggT family protein